MSSNKKSIDHCSKSEKTIEKPKLPLFQKNIQNKKPDNIKNK